MTKRIQKQGRTFDSDPDYKDRDKCRTCNHRIGWHVQSGKQPCFRPASLFSNSRCSCKEYVPTDNIKYLEWFVRKE